MNKEEQKELLKAFKKYADKITASKKESEKFLIRTGIHTEKGKLTKQYAS
ncbi:hypothetical protein [Leeuwenhoekiella marinoflava]|uniref:Uncharacterized protein n=2 Tax=Leeuwenhoekiella marinoflava TaxID=988 RepID=A0A4V1KSI6_9FLAO|nr:hypothetical protein [Leeuwenhoekiella marinoflava]RXG31868.1 hypothetical protein DSL99_1692 [Leeuwenhoekiella marinoflava]SHF02102.1 hypothetical protein SAMN02745246_01490 [Leeuwenhoekiella marinoflava DSM 3653]